MKIYPLILPLAFWLISCGKDDFKIGCLPSSLQDGVIAFYPFDNGSLADESSNGNNLSNSTAAAATDDRNGNSDCAYAFDNRNGFIQFLSAQSPTFLDNLTSFSISLWYEAHDTTIQGVYLEGLVGRGEGLKCPDRLGEWSVGIYDGRRPVFGHNNAVWTNSQFTDRIEKWHHVVAIKSNETYRIYLDGILHEEAIGNANCSNLHIAQDVGPLLIGNRFTGKVDDVLIYDREISQQNVLELFNLLPCCE